MTGSTERALGRIEGKLDGVQKTVDLLQQDVRDQGQEIHRLRDAIGRAAEKFDPETGALRPQYVAVPTEVQVQAVVESKARTKLWARMGKLVGVVTGLAGLAWVLLTEGRGE